MDASQRYSLRPRVNGDVSFRTSPLNKAEQHRRTRSFRQKRGREQRSVTRGHRGGNWNTNRIQISQKIGFRGDVRLTSKSPTRQPQNVALSVRSQRLEAVVKASTKKGALDRALQGILRCQEIAHGLRARSGIAST